VKIVVRHPPLPLLVLGILFQLPVMKNGKAHQLRPAPRQPADASTLRPLAKPPARAGEFAITSGWLRDRLAK
jgi:hypothetical protein